MNSARLMIALILVSFFSLNSTAATLKIALDHEPSSLDPHEQLTENTLQLSHLLFDPLIRWSQDNKLEARLAKKWQSIDSNTTRFTLRKGVTFHSGNIFSADDVIFTINRLQQSPDFKGLFGNILTLKKIDNFI